MEVYLVWHTHISEELIGGEDIKLIGVYSSAEGANLAVERAGCLNGFKDHKDGFEVSKSIIDKDEWQDGFVTE